MCFLTKILYFESFRFDFRLEPDLDFDLFRRELFRFDFLREPERLFLDPFLEETDPHLRDPIALTSFDLLIEECLTIPQLFPSSLRSPVFIALNPERFRERRFDFRFDFAIFMCVNILNKNKKNSQTNVL
jgi:hypothetical protein